MNKLYNPLDCYIQGFALTSGSKKSFFRRMLRANTSQTHYQISHQCQKKVFIPYNFEGVKEAVCSS